MRRTLRPLAAIAMVALISLISAGCSNAPAETGTGSGGGNQNAAAVTGTGSSGGNTNAATREQAVKFAECMRVNGVREFPDPNASGEFVYGIQRGTSLDPSTAAWKNAIGACKDLQPAGFMSKRSPEQQENALKFAQCMRDNGVKDFPDPTPDGPLIDTTSMGKGARSIPGLQAAMEKCRDVFAGALGG
jgi:hypothetical protein